MKPFDYLNERCEYCFFDAEIYGCNLDKKGYSRVERADEPCTKIDQGLCLVWKHHKEEVKNERS
jgi:hypothetical protein